MTDKIFQKEQQVSDNLQIFSRINQGKNLNRQQQGWKAGKKTPSNYMTCNLTFAGFISIENEGSSRASMF